MSSRTPLEASALASATKAISEFASVASEWALWMAALKWLRHFAKSCSLGGREIDVLDRITQTIYAHLLCAHSKNFALLLISAVPFSCRGPTAKPKDFEVLGVKREFPLLRASKGVMGVEGV